jgi:hypothetical protein
MWLPIQYTMCSCVHVTPNTVYNDMTLRPQSRYVNKKYTGLARNIYIRCIYSIFGRKITKHMVIYSVYTVFLLFLAGKSPSIWSYSVYIGCTSKVKGCLQLEHSTQRDVGLFLALCTGFQKAPALEVWARIKRRQARGFVRHDRVVCICACVCTCVCLCVCVLCMCVHVCAHVCVNNMPAHTHMH